MLLLFAISTIKELNSSSVHLSKDSSIPRPYAAVQSTLINALCVGFAVSILIRLMRDGSLPSPESKADVSDDDDPDCPPEYGLSDAILTVSDDEAMTDMPMACPDEIMDEFDTD
jgi:hypothetical protein